MGLFRVEGRLTGPTGRSEDVELLRVRFHIASSTSSTVAAGSFMAAA